MIPPDPRAADPIARLRALVNAQAEDAGLWFRATTAPEAYLQQELRTLHAAVEAAALPVVPSRYRCPTCGATDYTWIDQLGDATPTCSRCDPPVVPSEPPDLHQTLIEARNLCQSESQRWKTADPRTAEHWARVALELEDIRVGAALIEAQRVTKPMRDEALKAEDVSSDVMNMRLRAGRVLPEDEDRTLDVLKEWIVELFIYGDPSKSQEWLSRKDVLAVIEKTRRWRAGRVLPATEEKAK